MEAIIISKADFDEAFESAEAKLKAKRFESEAFSTDSRYQRDLQNMHRSFHYELYQLKDRLQKA